MNNGWLHKKFYVLAYTNAYFSAVIVERLNEAKNLFTKTQSWNKDRFQIFIVGLPTFQKPTEEKNVKKF